MLDRKDLCRQEQTRQYDCVFFKTARGQIPNSYQACVSNPEIAFVANAYIPGDESHENQRNP